MLWRNCSVFYCLVFMFLSYFKSQKVTASVKNDHGKQSPKENENSVQKHGTASPRGEWLKVKRSYKNNMVLKGIKDAERLNATCLDGSNAKFYISRKPASPHWIIHLQAGGSCVTKEDCDQRSIGPLGSSVFLARHITGEYTLTEDPEINPTFSLWNKVFIPYCSGDVFVGRMSKERHPFGIPMMGHYIVVAIIKQLIQDYQINRNGAKILFGGTSAGGLGVMANIDLVQKLTYPAAVKGYNDGGWFTLFPNYGEEFFSPGLPKFFGILTELFDRYWDGFVDESCRSQMPKAAACLYGELALKHIKAPMYVMVALWDSYQLTRLIANEYRSVSLPPKRRREKRYLSEFGNFTYRSIGRLITSTESGVFLPACYCHTFLTSCIEGNACQFPPSHIYTIKGRTAYTALSEWYISDGKRGTYVEVPQEEPVCNPTCCSLLCHKCQLPRRTVNYLPESNEPPKKSKRQKTQYYLYYSEGTRLQGSTQQIIIAVLLTIHWTIIFILS